jgi:hypothetical protein
VSLDLDRARNIVLDSTYGSVLMLATVSLAVLVAAISSKGVETSQPINEHSETLMRAYGTSCGIDFKFGGTVANTMPAHRLVQHFQETKGPETSNKLIDCLLWQTRCKGL